MQKITKAIWAFNSRISPPGILWSRSISVRQIQFLQQLKKKLQLTAFILLALLQTINAQAQQQPVINSTLTGKVTDVKTKESLAGVTLQIKGTTHATATDAHGNFKFLTGQKLPFALIVSFVGYETQEVAVTEGPVTIELKEASYQLASVVVVGYGTQKKSDLTGSVSSLPANFKSQPAASPDRLLQGAVAGAQVTQSSGAPGGSVSIRIRGGTSINAGNEPLYVIDGFPIYNADATTDAGVTAGPPINPLSGINPSDIASIDVLKDASATAIYGSRGANGVIIITTKRGNKGGFSVNYDGYYGIQQSAQKIGVLNAQQWGALKNDALKDAGKSPFYTQEQLDNLGEGTDWQAAAFREAPMQSHSLSISSGNEKTKILFSGSLFKQDGIILNTGFNRYSGKLNLDNDVTSNFKLGVSLNGSLSESVVAPSGIVPNILSMVPVVPVRDETGNFTANSSFGSTVANPIATLSLQSNETKTTRFLANSFAEYRLLEGLTAKVSLGTDIVNNKQNRYLPSTLFESSPGGNASIGSLGTLNWLNENTLNYRKTFNSKHSIDLLIGNTQQKSRTETYIAGASNFVSDEFTYNNIGGGTVLVAPSSSSIEWALQSFLARVNYGYDNRYLLTLTARADGSSRFSKNNKWGTFPSAAFAWNVSNEEFLKNSRQINSLKLRLSAGLTGNQEIDPYRSLARLGSFQYSFGNTLVNGLATSSFENPNLTWEKTAQYDFGFDLELFNSRIQLTSDIYYKRTSDLLLEVPVPYSSSVTSAFQNLGVVANRGVELGLKTANLRGEFDWNTNVLLSVNRNKIESLGGANYFFVTDPASPTTLPTQIIKVGESVGAFYTLVADGVDPATGLQKYKDLNHDGAITQDADRTIVGSAQPKFLASISNTFKYKNFDLFVFFNSSYGNKIFNWTRANLELGTGYTGAVSSLLNRWTPTNTITDVHKAIENPAVTISDRFVEDGSFIRLKTLSLGYNLPQKLVAKGKFKAARIYVTASNLYTWTNYSGYDPEVSTNGQNSLSSGLDRGAYPNAKSFIAGISLTL
ncbi:TonB-dependent receptor [Solitalea sp. MAHUQ-68]|uniref:TonB-dependent receptor n=1 Tax=Solitalea agri TaxID=2953739 RepID=A0A9X2JG94_9SPHI|nr:TonB-dependent receptor [Solitalea agri]MCO4294206.1 TonB-dependent receptor [Solitalea agri]